MPRNTNQVQAATDPRAVVAERRRRLIQTLVAASAFALILFANLFPEALSVINPVFVFFAWIAFALQTVQVHLGILFAPVALIAFVRRQRRAAILFGAVFVLSVAPVVFEFVPRRALPAGPTLRIMSLNLREGGYDPALVLAQVRAADGDVVCFQEYNADGHRRLFPLLTPLYEYHIVAPTPEVRGTAIFSRLPLSNAEDAVFDLGQGGGPQIVTRVEIGGRPVRLYCVHLAQPKRFSRFAHQRLEVGRLLAMLDTGSGPALVIGDMNATNRSYSAALLSNRGFVDASGCAGGGLQWTWPTYRRVPWLRLLRLDHMFLSSELSARRAEVLSYAGSDHRPIVAEIGFPAGPTQR
jgi:endonuclease/exonuclease/phosphatase (EEP) superfamily protein YafD